jgi:hypothetical protein
VLKDVARSRARWARTRDSWGGEWLNPWKYSVLGGFHFIITVLPTCSPHPSSRIQLSSALHAASAAGTISCFYSSMLGPRRRQLVCCCCASRFCLEIRTPLFLWRFSLCRLSCRADSAFFKYHGLGEIAAREVPFVCELPGVQARCRATTPVSVPAGGRSELREAGAPLSSALA